MITTYFTNWASYQVVTVNCEQSKTFDWQCYSLNWSLIIRLIPKSRESAKISRCDLFQNQSIAVEFEYCAWRSSICAHAIVIL